MKPLIGISGSYDYVAGNYMLAASYVKAIEAAGGLPVIIPYVKEISDLKEIMLYIDALLLTGGGDPDPIFFNEEPNNGTGSITPDRDIFEIEIIQMAVDRGYPVLGICRGMQLINIWGGGKIYQDLYQSVDKPVKHVQDAPKWYPTHKVQIEKGTKLASVLGEGDHRVNSFHHQSVSKVAPDFIVSASSADGVIEAIENVHENFVVGVQWHPEHLWEKNDIFFKLFQAFVDAAK